LRGSEACPAPCDDVVVVVLTPFFSLYLYLTNILQHYYVAVLFTVAIHEPTMSRKLHWGKWRQLPALEDFSLARYY